MIYILLKFHSVLCTFDFAITNTVISKQHYLWVNVCCDIVNIQWEKTGPRTVPWGTPDKTGAQSDFIPFTTTHCCLKQRKESIHFRVFSPNTMRGVSKAFLKSKINVSTCLPLSEILAQTFITVTNWVSQLCLFLNACSYMWTLPDHEGGSLKWAQKFLLKHTTFYQNFKISLIWIKNVPIYSIHFWKNLTEMKGKSPWYPFVTYHMYACCLCDKSSSKCAMILEHTMCSSNLHWYTS